MKVIVNFISTFKETAFGAKKGQKLHEIVAQPALDSIRGLPYNNVKLMPSLGFDLYGLGIYYV